MREVSLFEAYYGCEVILDYASDAGREAAFHLALLTLQHMEHAFEPAPFRIAWEIDVPGLPADPGPLSLMEAVAILESVVTPEHRYLSPFKCHVGGREPYTFSVLSEDGSCVAVGPGWRARNEWFDRFWSTLWTASLALESTLPGFRLRCRGAEDRRCVQGHRMSPFRDTCEHCDGKPRE